MSSHEYWGAPRMLPELEPEECQECNHPIRLHGPDGCEYERDRWQPGESMGGWVAHRCGCREADPFQALLAKHWEKIQKGTRNEVQRTDRV